MFQLGERALDLSGPGPHRARHPVERPQLIEDGALDAVDGVGLELDAAFEVELVDGIDEPEDAVGHQVSLFHVARQADGHPTGDELDEGRIQQDQTLASVVVLSCLELLPQAERVVVGSLVRLVGGFVHR